MMMMVARAMTVLLADNESQRGLLCWHNLLIMITVKIISQKTSPWSINTIKKLQNQILAFTKVNVTITDHQGAYPTAAERDTRFEHCEHHYHDHHDHLCRCKPCIKQPIQQLLNKILALTKVIVTITTIAMNTITMTTMITCAVVNPASSSLSNSCWTRYSFPPSRATASTARLRSASVCFVFKYEG